MKMGRRKNASGFEAQPKTKVRKICLVGGRLRWHDTLACDLTLFVLRLKCRCHHLTLLPGVWYTLS